MESEILKIPEKARETQKKEQIPNIEFKIKEEIQKYSENKLLEPKLISSAINNKDLNTVSKIVEKLVEEAKKDFSSALKKVLSTRDPVLVDAFHDAFIKDQIVRKK